MIHHKTRLKSIATTGTPKSKSDGQHMLHWKPGYMYTWKLERDASNNISNSASFQSPLHRRKSVLLISENNHSSQSKKHRKQKYKKHHMHLSSKKDKSSFNDPTCQWKNIFHILFPTYRQL
jgi:hypothetical protein